MTATPFFLLRLVLAAGLLLLAVSCGSHRTVGEGMEPGGMSEEDAQYTTSGWGMK